MSTDDILSFCYFDPVANKGKRDAKTVELYRDYCIFMLETYMRPADVLLLKADNIKSCHIGYKSPVVRYIPKKMENRNHKTVNVPLSPVALGIIEKYKGQSSDGYVFPFASNDRINGYKDDIERFSKYINQQINAWLKTVDKALNFNIGIKFSLYVFRHTSISIALNVHNTPVSTVAQIAGTSIQMIEKHYNNHTVSNIPNGILESLPASSIKPIQKSI